jgi:hypothetical protein
VKTYKRIVLGFLAVGAMVTGARAYAQSAPHLELDLTGAEYRELNKSRVVRFSTVVDPLDAILAAGKRNLEWVDFINQTRDGSTKLQISSEATQVGIPIENVGTSNREIVLTAYNIVRGNLPALFSSVLFENAPLTRDLNMTDEEFLTHVRLIDKSYQRASRWLLQEPYLEEYASNAVDDVRGYYFLKQDADLQAHLVGFNNLAADMKTKYQGWLIGQCVNSVKDVEQCTTDFTASLAANQSALPFYQLWVGDAETHFNSYFVIPESRTDVTWSSQAPNLMSIPFLNPHNADVLSWLQTNIEDEFHFGQWQLKLNFLETGDDATTTHVRFQPGATPHVNGIAGNEITMDGNRNLNEYSSRWTIRHEYGHVLGFPDCYLEFYDKDNAVMINYQLDITNLMCSRRGKLQPKHVDELKRVYFH